MLPGTTEALRAIQGAFHALADTLALLREALTILAQVYVLQYMPRRTLCCIAIEKTSLGPRFTLRPIPVTGV